MRNTSCGRGLAERLGFGEHFPWNSEAELADYRLAPVGLTFKEAATKTHLVKSDERWTYDRINPRTGKPTGFATISGKVELYSNVLEKLGYDPLPYYEEPPISPYSTPELAEEYPYILITGGNFRPMFHSENRQPGLGTREQYPWPIMDIHPETAAKHGIGGRRLGLCGDAQGRHPAARPRGRRDRPCASLTYKATGGIPSCRTGSPGSAACGESNCNSAHTGGRPGPVRPGHGRLADARTAVQNL